jgi:hypothetical protein
MKHIKILSALPLVILVASCDHSSSTALNGGSHSAGLWIVPGAGTEYVYQSSTQGSTLTALSTIDIIETRQHVGGKTNVISYGDITNGLVATGFYNFEQNGDISFGDSTTSSSGAGNFTWRTFPTASIAPISDPAVDTTESGVHILSTDVRTFIAEESTTTPGGSFATLHVRETITNIETSSDSIDFNASDTTVRDTWFAPSIGTYIKSITNATNEGQAQPQTEVELISYLPK